MTHPSDKELDDYLRRDSQLSQRYRLLDEGDVPPALDAAVLAQARAAVAPKKQRLPAWVRRGSPLALAASAVMIVAIVLEVGVQDELRVPAPQLERAAKRADAAVATESTPAPSPSASTGAAPPPAESTEAKAASDVVERPLQAFEAREPELAIPRQAAPPPGVAAQPMTVAVPAEESTLARAREAADTSARASAGLETEQVVAAAGNRRAGNELVEQVVITGSYRRNDVSNDRTRPAFGPRAPGAPRPRGETYDNDAADTRAYSSPESWLIAIRRLRVDGKNAEADEQWREFRREYPNFEVRAGDRALPESQR